MKLYLKSAIRNLTKNPVYSLITFSGFALSIAAALYIYLWVYSELSHDKFHMGFERTYRVLTVTKQGNELVKSPGAYRPIAATLKSDYPQIEYATYLSYSSEDSPLQVAEGSEKIEARELWVSNDFFSIFNGFVFIEGEAFDAIETPSGIILSEMVARKLFGNETALGKQVIIDKYTKSIYEVAGVVRIPANSHINFGYIIPEVNSKVTGYSNHWGDKGHVHVYFKLAQNAVITDSFLSELTNHVTRYSNKPDKLQFQPLADIHLRTNYQPSIYDRNISSFRYIWIFSGLALIIILMASLNFSVLAVARASERSKEIGIKKVNGASRMHIIIQFMTESVVHIVAATLAALLLIWILLPFINSISGNQIEFTFTSGLIRNILVISLLTAIAAGAYPSLYLSSLLPVGILKGGNLTGSRAGFIRLLVTAQFSITIFFLVASSLFMLQHNYIRTKDLGFNQKDIVVIPTGLWYDNKGFKDELQQNPNIKGVSASTYAPVEIPWTMPLHYSHQGVSDTLITTMLWADEDFAKTYNLEVVKGRFLQMDYSQYWEQLKKSREKQESGDNPTISIPIVINQTAERLLGFDDPIGQRIGKNVIVGVVRDFHYRPVHHPIGPLLITNNPETIMTMNVRISSNNRAETLKFIRDTYRKHRQDRGFSYQFFEDMLQERYLGEIRMKNITIAFTIIGIVISSLGILGMAMFSISRRFKEIGIRKVNGATIAEILLLLNKDFVKWVAIAFVIATPIAWYAMNKWLQNFAYKTELSWWIFALAGLLALGIALLTVSWQSLRAATRNPVEALRYE
jgi:putative ABC transport system permease protein